MVILAGASFPLCLPPYGWEPQGVLGRLSRGMSSWVVTYRYTTPSLSSVNGISREDPGLRTAYGCLILAHYGCHDSPGVPQFGVP